MKELQSQTPLHCWLLWLITLSEAPVWKNCQVRLPYIAGYCGWSPCQKPLYGRIAKSDSPPLLAIVAHHPVRSTCMEELQSQTPLHCWLLWLITLSEAPVWKNCKVRLPCIAGYCGWSPCQKPLYGRIAKSDSPALLAIVAHYPVSSPYMEELLLVRLPCIASYCGWSPCQNPLYGRITKSDSPALLALAAHYNVRSPCIACILWSLCTPHTDCHVIVLSSRHWGFNKLPLLKQNPCRPAFNAGVRYRVPPAQPRPIFLV